MTDEQINIAVAEVTGWRVVACHVGKNIPPHLIAYERGPNETVIASGMPNYCHDLNAIAEVVATLTDEQHADYRSYLRRITGTPNLDLNYRVYLEATARQRCEALLRALLKWKDRL